MENVSSVILTSDLALWSKFVRSVISDLSKGDAPSAVARVSPTLTIAENVLKWKKTEMGVQK